MKFLFLYPASGKWEITPEKAITPGANLPPLGILYLSKILELNGHKAEVIDFNAETLTEDKIKEKIFSSDAVGMTIYTEPIALKNSITLSNFVKECDPDIPVLIGGPHCSIEPEKTIISHNADILVRGEGELVIIPIADAIQGRRKLSTIPGVYYRENDKYNYQSDGQLKERFLHAPLGAVHRVRLPEDTPQPAALHLEQGDQYQGCRHHYLRNIQVSFHVILHLPYLRLPPVSA